MQLVLDILHEPGLTKEERDLWATPLHTNKKKSNGKRGEGWDVEGLNMFEEHFEKMEEARDVCERNKQNPLSGIKRNQLKNAGSNCIKIKQEEDARKDKKTPLSSEPKAERKKMKEQEE